VRVRQKVQALSRSAKLISDQPSVDVAVGVLLADHRRVLIAERPAGSHQAGWWEFPGGKIQAPESACEALARELDEEIGITVRSARELLTCTHEYPDRIVTLHVFVVEDYSGEPRGVEGQALRWEPIDGLMEVGLLPADLPIVDALREIS